MAREWVVDGDDLDPAEDAFGRQVFVRQCIAALEAARASSDSAVFGLVGDWGSGKTQTLRWVRARIRDDPKRWRVVEMGAWATAGPDGVTLELLRTLAAALGGRRWSRISRALGSIARAAVPVVAPTAGLLAGLPWLGAVGPVLALLGWKDAVPTPKGAPVHSQIEALGRQTAKQKQVTLVVVDDVDRLQPDELLALFKAVRVLGRLPQVHYLLAYDEDTLLHLMALTPVGSDPARAVAYLEKVVTHRLDQPPAGQEDAERVLRRELDAALEAAGAVLSGQERSRWDEQVTATFSVLMPTVRSAHRFTSQLRTLLPLVSFEAVDVVDFAVLTLLRSRYPDLYRRLSRDQAVLTGRRDSGDDEAALASWQGGSAFEAVAWPYRTTVRAAVGAVFPLSLDPRGDQPALRMLRESQRAPRRASNPDYVDRYFSLAPPAADDHGALVSGAFHEWTGPGPGSAWAQLVSVVEQGGVDAKGASAAARLLRVAQAHPQSTEPTAVPTALRMALALFCVPVIGSRPSVLAPGVRTEALAWLAASVAAAAPTAEQLRKLAARQPEETDDTWVAQRLLALHHVLLFERSPGLDYDGLSRAAAEAMWQVCEDDARRRGEDPATSYANHGQPSSTTSDSAHLDQQVHPEQAAQQRIDEPLPTAALLHAANELCPGLADAAAARALQAGVVDLLDLAACWVDEADRQAGVMALEKSLAVVRVLGLSRVQATLISEAAGHDDPLEQLLQAGGDRGVAAHGLLLVAEAAPDRARLPRGVEPVLGGFAPPPELLLQQGLNEADLLLSAVLLLPSANANVEATLGERAWQRLLEQVSSGDAVTGWLHEVGPAWNVFPEGWATVQDRSRRPRELVTSLVITSAVPVGSALDRPVRIWAQLAQVPPGDSQSSPGLRLTLDVGVWLDGLGRHRFPAQPKQAQGPLPTALAATEAGSLVSAVLRWLAQGAQAARPLLAAAAPRGGAVGDQEVRLQVRLSGSGEPRRSVWLEHLAWAAGSGPATTHDVVAFPVGHLDQLAQDSGRLAEYFLDHWVQQAGGSGRAGWQGPEAT